MQSIFTILFLILCLKGSSQDYPGFEKYLYDNRFTLTWAPYSMIDPNPRLRLGLEYNFTEKDAINVDFGLSSAFMNQTLEYEGFSDFYRFFEIRPQYKKILWTGYDSRIYMAFELFISSCYKDFHDSYYYPDQQNHQISFEYAQAKRKKEGVHVICGWQFYLFDLFMIDLYGGTGVAQTRIQYTYVQNGIQDQNRYSDYSLYNPFLYEGSKILPNLALGLKLGIIN